MSDFLINNRIRNYKWIVLIFSSFLIFFFEYLNLASPIKNFTLKIFSPFIIMGNKVVQSGAAPFQTLRAMYKSARRVQDLELRLSEALAEIGELESLKKENQELREILKSTDRELGQVIITTPIVSFAKPAIFAGSKQGIKNNLMVIYKGTLLGMVDEVNENYSTVNLLNMKTSQPILAQTQNHTQGLVVGDGKNVIFSEIPIESEMNIGDQVISLGQLGIKRDVFIGRIREIKSSPTSSTKRAILEQLVSFYETSVVEIK